MTKNQIEYWKGIRESEQAMRELEETRRANKMREALQMVQNAEAHRTNIEKERETNRSNIARERETHRANLAGETETRRANLAREGEAKRSNLANESIKVLANQEQARANRANEALSAARNAETQRANLAAEDISRQQISLGYTNAANTAASIAESRRASMAQEEVNRQNAATNASNAETNRLNAETRSGELQEAITNNLRNFALSTKKYGEQVRTNKASEANARRGQDVQATSNVFGVIGNFVGRLMGASLTKTGRSK